MVNIESKAMEKILQTLGEKAKMISIYAYNDPVYRYFVICKLSNGLFGLAVFDEEAEIIKFNTGKYEKDGEREKIIMRPNDSAPENPTYIIYEFYDKYVVKQNGYYVQRIGDFPEDIDGLCVNPSGTSETLLTFDYDYNEAENLQNFLEFTEIEKDRYALETYYWMKGKKYTFNLYAHFGGEDLVKCEVDLFKMLKSMFTEIIKNNLKPEDFTCYFKNEDVSYFLCLSKNEYRYFVLIDGALIFDNFNPPKHVVMESGEDLFAFDDFSILLRKDKTMNFTRLICKSDFE